MADLGQDFLVDGLQGFHFVVQRVLFLLQVVFGFEEEFAVPIARVGEDGLDGVLKAKKDNEGVRHFGYKHYQGPVSLKS